MACAALLGLALIAGACKSSSTPRPNSRQAADQPAPTSAAAVEFIDLRAALLALVSRAVERPTSQALLTAAWRGVIAEAKNERLNVDTLQMPEFVGDPAADFKAFSSAFAPALVKAARRPNATQLDYAAVDAMAASLDDSHTTFVAPANLVRQNRRDAGNLGTTVGFRLQRTTNPPPLVLEVVSGSAAERAGLRAGDTLLSLDGRPVQGWTARELGRALEGEDGTVMKLSIRRAGSTRTQEITLVRRTMALDIVSSRVLPGNIGYIRLREFPNRDFAIRQIDQALQDFAADGVAGIVLDLRGDPGGSLGVLQPLTSRFVSQDPLALVQDRTGSPQPLKRVGGFDLSVRYVVLVDDGSASSSELLASAVKEYHDGLVVGDHTCGCLMEAIFSDLPDQAAGLEVAVARVLSPVDHVEIEKHPLVPDLLVPADPRLLNQGRDPQLEAALKALGVAGERAATVTYAVSQGNP